MATQTERRQNSRINVRWPVTILKDDSIMEGETRNISLTGVLIRCNEPMHKNEFLRLALEPPKRQSIWVSGEVAWSDSERDEEIMTNHSMGFSLIEISEVDRALLEDLCTLVSNQNVQH